MLSKEQKKKGFFMEKVLKDFAKKIKTKEELTFYLEEIAQVQQVVFKNKRVPLSKKVEGKVSGELKNFLEGLEKEEVISKNPEQQSSFLEKLKKYLQSFPEIKLEIAFLPSDEFLTRINQWLEEKLGQKVILNLITNPQIVGGAVIEYQGNWRNFSLVKELDKLISQRS